MSDLNKNGAVPLTCPVGGLTNFCRSSFDFSWGPTQTTAVLRVEILLAGCCLLFFIYFSILALQPPC